MKGREIYFGYKGRLLIFAMIKYWNRSIRSHEISILVEFSIKTKKNFLPGVRHLFIRSSIHSFIALLEMTDYLMTDYLNMYKTYFSSKRQDSRPCGLFRFMIFLKCCDACLNMHMERMAKRRWSGETFLCRERLSQLLTIRYGSLWLRRFWEMRAGGPVWITSEGKMDSDLPITKVTQKLMTICQVLEKVPYIV